jgi:hypothetical protein
MKRLTGVEVRLQRSRDRTRVLRGALICREAVAGPRLTLARLASLPGPSVGPRPGDLLATRRSRRNREPNRPRSGRFGYRLHILLRDGCSCGQGCGGAAGGATTRRASRSPTRMLPAQVAWSSPSSRARTAATSCARSAVTVRSMIAYDVSK